MDTGHIKTEITNDGRWKKVVRTVFVITRRPLETQSCLLAVFHILACHRSLTTVWPHAAKRVQLHAVIGIRLVLLLYNNRTLKVLNSNNHFKRKITTGWWVKETDEILLTLRTATDQGFPFFFVLSYLQSGFWLGQGGGGRTTGIIRSSAWTMEGSTRGKKEK